MSTIASRAAGGELKIDPLKTEETGRDGSANPDADDHQDESEASAG